MQPSRLRRIWRFLGWCFVVAAIWLSLTPEPPSVVFAAGDKPAHFLGYTALMLWFAQLHRALTAKVRAALALIVLGIVLEILQGIGGVRSAEALDALANACGVGGGLLLSLTPCGSLLRWLEAQAQVNH
jgi:VanZ family protein